MTPQKQLEKWLREGFGALYMDDDGFIKDRHAGRVYPCKWCGDPVYYDNDFCEGCWELDHRIDDLRDLPIPIVESVFQRVNTILQNKYRGVR